ncbi:MAG: major facilitator superfamily 1, partial [Homoserinimonas sp.]|nr:major facilitator superfamily 1 [Homoserinimonas sp.]
MSIAVYPGGLSRAQVLGWRNAVFVIFAACGMGIASLMARTPSVKEDLSIRTDQLGVLIFGLAIGSITGLIASSHVISWFGTRKIMKWCLVFGPLGLATAGVGISVLHNFAAAFVGLAIFGAVMSLCDVAMNLSGAVNERVLGKSIMPVFHAFFSFGTMLGAGAAAVAAAAGISVAVQSAVIAAVILVA